MFLPSVMATIKNVVTAFVARLGLPFCSKKHIEDELSRSISQALLDASGSEITLKDDSSDRLSSIDISSISASLRDNRSCSFLSTEQLVSFEKELTRGLHKSFRMKRISPAQEASH